MDNRFVSLIACFILCAHLADASHRSSPFVFDKAEEIFQSEAGSLSLLPPAAQGLGLGLALNVLTLEPKALLIPQYLDSPFLIFVYQGKMTLGFITKNGTFSQQNMEAGDIYTISSGSVFYILNTDEGQRLRVFGIVDTSQTGEYQPFFVTGGVNPRPVLAGFPTSTLAVAYKVPREEINSLLSGQSKGPIIYTTREQYTKLSARNAQAKKEEGSSIKPFNVLKKEPDYQNDNGWTVAASAEDFSPLRELNLGVFAVNLKAGAMVAPHWNPVAMEIIIPTKGEGWIQIAFPNGSNALDHRVTEGVVVAIPRGFPMCQIASREGTFEFVGFSTSSAPSCPQFFAGSNSIYNALDNETLALAFDNLEEVVARVLRNQPDAVILSGFIEEGDEDRHQEI